MRTPADHPLFQELTDQQRAAVNAVWDEVVVAALDESDRRVREHREARVQWQDEASVLRRDLREERARRDRAERELWVARVHGGET